MTEGLRPGELVIMPRKRPETTLEIAEQAVEVAYSKLQCAMVELEGARTRLAMVRTWKASQKSTPRT